IFNMTCVVLASEEDDPMAELIIIDYYKTLLLAAADQPLRGTIVELWVTGWNADFVGGKGRGRVVLLHALLSAISVATKEATTAGRVAKEIKLTIDYVETVLNNRRRLREDVNAATEFYLEKLAKEGVVRGVEV
ncbi:hypothetical protein GT037_005461, partial [Alternaria burnsii]